MYDVREDLAEAFDCENRLHPEQADAGKAQSTRFGNYVGAVFQVKTANLTGEAVATVWARENGAWKLMSYHEGTGVPAGHVAKRSAPAGCVI